MESGVNALDVLRAEHRLIEQMLSALDAVARGIERGEQVPPFTDDLLDFFQQFADQTHHAKEEERLFPALAADGFGPNPVVDAMMHQHDLARTHVRDLRRALARLRAGDVAARSDFTASAAAYSELLRVHIQIEDEDLYPIAERIVAETGDRSLFDEFERVDASPTAQAQRARWDDLRAKCRPTVVR